MSISGGMAEWFKAAVLKTVERKFRRFESYSLRQLSVNDQNEFVVFVSEKNSDDFIHLR